MPPVLFFARIVLVIWGSSVVASDFSNFFPVKKCHWRFDRYYIESVDHFEYYSHFNNINSSSA